MAENSLETLHLPLMVCHFFSKTILTLDNCVDPEVYKSVNEVFKQNKGASVDVLAQQLAVTINKPGWAYLVYEVRI